MNQSSLIVGAIFITFFMYITIKGELPTYAGLLLLAPSNGTSGNAINIQGAAINQPSSAIFTGAIGELF